MNLSPSSQKNTDQDTSYKTGFPPKKGWYDCRIDGIQMNLYCFICDLKPKSPYWVDEEGQKVLDPVEWR